MMGRKTFLERNGLKLCGDERDVMVPKRHYHEVMAWCADQGIVVESAFNKADYESRLSANLFDVNLWRVRNEQHRVAFALRWS